MAYTQILKVFYWNLKQTQFVAHTYSRLPPASWYVHTLRPMSTVSRLTFPGGAEAAATLLPSCFMHTRTRRCVSLDAAARNKVSPEDRDRQKSVSRYQSGSPTHSAAQKGKLSEASPVHVWYTRTTHVTKMTLSSRETTGH